MFIAGEASGACVVTDDHKGESPNVWQMQDTSNRPYYTKSQCIG